MTPTIQPVDFVTFSLIIDDIVFPDGQTRLGVLGGGGPQAAFGLKLWADRVGLVGGVGRDLPETIPRQLRTIGVDVAGLRHSGRWPTPRAWQVYDADGRRVQTWRVPGPAIAAQLGRSLDQLPPAYRQARGFHLGVHPEQAGLGFIHALRDLGAVVSLEPFRPPQRPLTTAELGNLLSAAPIFSPNRQEAEALVGPGQPGELIQRLVEAGAEIVALRQGVEGATVHQAQTGETWHIPAFATTVIDPTGAGNAFCGGFLAGWVQTGDLRSAGLYGATAASFLVEQVGLPKLSTNWREEARRRLAVLAKRVVRGYDRHR